MKKIAMQFEVSISEDIVSIIQYDSFGENDDKVYINKEQIPLLIKWLTEIEEE